MEVIYFDRKGEFIPNDSTDHKETFTGAFLNTNTTIFSEDDEKIPESAKEGFISDPWVDVRYNNNMSVFMDNENMSIYLRLDDCESGKKKFVSVTLDSDEIEQFTKFIETVSILKKK